MGILLVRHAHAVPEQRGSDDAMRWLTVEGRAQARQVAQAVRDKGIAPVRFVASPRVRAVQTAELFAQGLGFGGAVETLGSLSYTVPAERAARELAAVEGELAEGGIVAAFGHMPTIAEIAATLTGGSYQGSLGLSEALWIDEGRVVWSLGPH